jgi:hypothetical protein
VRRFVALVLGALLMAGCGGGGSERACGLLEQLPPRVEELTVGQIQELVEAATGSDRARIRAIGGEIQRAVQSRIALERLAPGASRDALEFQLERLREACGDLQEAGP